jgi:hypothetical protein
VDVGSRALELPTSSSRRAQAGQCYPGRTMRDPDFERRAAERRARLTGGKAGSFAELEDEGRRFWDEAPPVAKLVAVRDALVEAWILRGKHGPPPRFVGSAHGVLTFER